MEYGPNMTQDPGTAARYMAPAQVVTFPLVPEGYPEIGDPEKWFYANHSGIRLDAIEARSPDQLAGEFKRRIKDRDRYGQKRKPFYLEWPTDYAVITQPFGANPQIYTRFGMPGHEGLDIRARNNTNIYCCAPGVVYRVHLMPDSHAYGIHIRVQHKDGYKTVYGHLARVFVREGEMVEAGQLIGYADSTGASTGAHLHLTLKRDGATKRKETTYPKDVIDPTAFMVWPQRGSRKSIPETLWAPERCLVGAHGRTRGGLTEADIQQIRTAKLEALKINLGESIETIDSLREWNPSLFLVVRASTDFSGPAVTSQTFLSNVENEIGRYYRAGIRYFELHANPNLQVEGWQRSWSGGEEFSIWIQEVARRLKELFPDISLGFPGLSPGETVSGWRANAEEFLRDAEAAVHELDWCGVHCYWMDRFAMQSIQGGRLFEFYRNRFPEKLLMVTEFYNASPSAPAASRAEQALAYFRSIRHEQGVGAAFSFAVSSPEGYESIVWGSDEHPGLEWAEIIGGRSF
ncbi:MAG: M23 family metallopeptidase [Anaerolineales bacterium]|nr:M23 family metallopeptidase [Anaerolineales bacterium]